MLGSAFAASPLVAPAADPSNAFRREPILIYDSTTATVPGQLETSLVVYNDGRIILGTNSFFYTGSVEEVLVAKTVSPAELQALFSGLLSAGATHLTDGASVGPGQDTVTFFHPQGRRSNTFTYGAFSGPHLKVGTIIQRFIARHARPASE